jgi:hypothetical protein
MVNTFFDSSVLVSVYVPQVHSEAARKAVTQVSRVPYTPLHHLEVRNAFRLLIGWKRLTPAEALSVFSQLEEDVAAGRFMLVPLDLYALFSKAELLSARHATRLLPRSLDILHVAAALELSCKQFVTFDSRQRRLAAACGLEVVDLAKPRPRARRR